MSGQALKAIFQMNKYLHKCTSLSVQHRLNLFKKLITPILRELRAFTRQDVFHGAPHCLVFIHTVSWNYHILYV